MMLIHDAKVQNAITHRLMLELNNGMKKKLPFKSLKCGQAKTIKIRCNTLQNTAATLHCSFGQHTLVVP